MGPAKGLWKCQGSSMQKHRHPKLRGLHAPQGGLHAGLVSPHMVLRANLGLMHVELSLHCRQPCRAIWLGLASSLSTALQTYSSPGKQARGWHVHPTSVTSHLWAPHPTYSACCRMCQQCWRPSSRPPSSLPKVTLSEQGVGLTLEEAMRFWRMEFVPKCPSDQFEKKYAYNVRYNYGREGRKSDYTPYSCLKIISSQPGQAGQPCPVTLYRWFRWMHAQGAVGWKGLCACSQWHVLRHMRAQAMQEQVHGYACKAAGTRHQAPALTSGPTDSCTLGLRSHRTPVTRSPPSTSLTVDQCPACRTRFTAALTRCLARPS